MWIVAAFRRNDRRVKGRFYTQKRDRQTRRTRQHLHKISKDIIQKVKQNKSLIAFENLKGIRKLPKRKRPGKLVQKKNEWMAVLRTAKADTVQGSLGGNPSVVCRSKAHKHALSNMRRATRGQAEQSQVVVQ
jgi:hypothetical protein